MVKERISNKVTWKPFANKSCFALELTEAEINALVDNTAPRNTKEELMIMEFLIEQ